MSERISIKQYITDFNRSQLRRTLIPDSLYSGWPSLSRRGKCLCITIPYYSRTTQKDHMDLYPLFCSITLALSNPQKVFDFTLYPYDKDWKDIEYAKPCGQFKHPALKEVKTRQEYQALCDQFFSCYDDLLQAILTGTEFTGIEEMRRLSSILMEPSHYPQYLKIQPKFYSHICQL